MTDGRREDKDRDETERWRVAAEETLAQLDWCVSYLRRIRKRQIAAALARNGAEIRRRMG